jgi:branched-chain amino acid transport system substrate-binding protein
MSNNAFYPKYLRNRFVQILFIFMALLVMLSACQSTQQTTQEPIKIGFVTGLTGSGAYISGHGKDAMTLAVEEINASGGLLGRQIQLSIQDSQGQPPEAVNVLRKFDSDGFKLVIGPQTSSEVLTALPVMQELKSVGITSFSTSPAITEAQGVGGNEYMFRVNPPDNAMARTLIKIAIEQLGDKRFSIVTRNDDFGLGASEAFQAAIVEFGGEITSANEYQVGGSYDFLSTLTRIKGEDPDAIVFIGTLEQGIPFIKQYHELGLTAQIYTRGVTISPALYEQLGPDFVNGIMSAEPYYAEIDTAENKAFVEKWMTRFGVAPINQGYYTYAAIQLMAAAIKEAGSDDPEKVKESLKTVSFDGVTGVLKFDDHNQAYSNIYIGRVDCTGDTADTCKVTVVASASSAPSE